MADELISRTTKGEPEVGETVLKLSSPKKKEKKTAPKTAVVYSPQECYTQMGSINFASIAARTSLRRLSILLDDVEVSRNRQADSLINRIKEVSQMFADLEILIMKFEHSRVNETKSLIENALADATTALNWFKRMLEAHKSEDREELTPVLKELHSIVLKITDIRKTKIENAVEMEKKFAKARNTYWKERTENISTKIANANKPVVHQNANPDTYSNPTPALDLKSLIQQASEEIKNKKKAKKDAETTEN